MLLSIIPSRLMPGIIGTSTEKVIASAPMIVSFTAAPALCVQKKSGANRSQRPTPVEPHCAQEKRRESASEPKSISRTPDAMSLHPVSALRNACSGSPRSCVISRTARAASGSKSAN